MTDLEESLPLKSGSATNGIEIDTNGVEIGGSTSNGVVIGGSTSHGVVIGLGSTTSNGGLGDTMSGINGVVFDSDSETDAQSATGRFEGRVRGRKSAFGTNKRSIFTGKGYCPTSGLSRRPSSLTPYVPRKSYTPEIANGTEGFTFTSQLGFSARSRYLRSRSPPAGAKGKKNRSKSANNANNSMMEDNDIGGSRTVWAKFVENRDQEKIENELQKHERELRFKFIPSARIAANPDHRANGSKSSGDSRAKSEGATSSFASSKRSESLKNGARARSETAQTSSVSGRPIPKIIYIPSSRPNRPPVPHQQKPYTLAEKMRHRKQYSRRATLQENDVLADVFDGISHEEINEDGQMTSGKQHKKNRDGYDVDTICRRQVQEQDEVLPEKYQHPVGEDRVPYDIWKQVSAGTRIMRRKMIEKQRSQSMDLKEREKSYIPTMNPFSSILLPPGGFQSWRPRIDDDNRQKVIGYKCVQPNIRLEDDAEENARLENDRDAAKVAELNEYRAVQKERNRLGKNGSNFRHKSEGAVLNRTFEQRIREFYNIDDPYTQCALGLRPELGSDSYIEGDGTLEKDGLYLHIWHYTAPGLINRVHCVNADVLEERKIQAAERDAWNAFKEKNPEEARRILKGKGQNGNGGSDDIGKGNSNPQSNPQGGGSAMAGNNAGARSGNSFYDKVSPPGHTTRGNQLAAPQQLASISSTSGDKANTSSKAADDSDTSETHQNAPNQEVLREGVTNAANSAHSSSSSSSSSDENEESDVVGVINGVKKQHPQAPLTPTMLKPLIEPPRDLSPAHRLGNIPGVTVEDTPECPRPVAVSKRLLRKKQVSNKQAWSNAPPSPKGARNSSNRGQDFPISSGWSGDCASDSIMCNPGDGFSTLDIGFRDTLTIPNLKDGSHMEAGSMETRSSTHPSSFVSRISYISKTFRGRSSNPGAGESESRSTNHGGSESRSTNPSPATPNRSINLTPNRRPNRHFTQTSSASSNRPAPNAAAASGKNGNRRSNRLSTPTQERIRREAEIFGIPRLGRKTNRSSSWKRSPRVNVAEVVLNETSDSDATSSLDTSSENDGDANNIWNSPQFGVDFKTNVSRKCQQIRAIQQACQAMKDQGRGGNLTNNRSSSFASNRQFRNKPGFVQSMPSDPPCVAENRDRASHDPQGCGLQGEIAGGDRIAGGNRSGLQLDSMNVLRNGHASYEPIRCSDCGSKWCGPLCDSSICNNSFNKRFCNNECRNGFCKNLGNTVRNKYNACWIRFFEHTTEIEETGPFRDQQLLKRCRNENPSKKRRNYLVHGEMRVVPAEESRKISSQMMLATYFGLKLAYRPWYFLLLCAGCGLARHLEKTFGESYQDVHTYNVVDETTGLPIVDPITGEIQREIRMPHPSCATVVRTSPVYGWIGLVCLGLFNFILAHRLNRDIAILAIQTLDSVILVMVAIKMICSVVANRSSCYQYSFDPSDGLGFAELQVRFCCVSIILLAVGPIALFDAYRTTRRNKLFLYAFVLFYFLALFVKYNLSANHWNDEARLGWGILQASARFHAGEAVAVIILLLCKHIYSIYRGKTFASVRASYEVVWVMTRKKKRNNTVVESQKNAGRIQGLENGNHHAAGGDLELENYINNVDRPCPSNVRSGIFQNEIQDNGLQDDGDGILPGTKSIDFGFTTSKIQRLRNKLQSSVFGRKARMLCITLCCPMRKGTKMFKNFCKGIRNGWNRTCGCCGSVDIVEPATTHQNHDIEIITEFQDPLDIAKVLELTEIDAQRRKEGRRRADRKQGKTVSIETDGGFGDLESRVGCYTTSAAAHGVDNSGWACEYGSRDGRYSYMVGSIPNSNADRKRITAVEKKRKIAQELSKIAEDSRKIAVHAEQIVKNSKVSLTKHMPSVLMETAGLLTGDSNEPRPMLDICQTNLLENTNHSSNEDHGKIDRSEDYGKIDRSEDHSQTFENSTPWNETIREDELKPDNGRLGLTNDYEDYGWKYPETVVSTKFLRGNSNTSSIRSLSGSQDRPGKAPEITTANRPGTAPENNYRISQPRNIECSNSNSRIGNVKLDANYKHEHVDDAELDQMLKDFGAWDCLNLGCNNDNDGKNKDKDEDSTFVKRKPIESEVDDSKPNPFLRGSPKGGKDGKGKNGEENRNDGRNKMNFMLGKDFAGKNSFSLKTADKHTNDFMKPKTVVPMNQLLEKNASLNSTSLSSKDKVNITESSAKRDNYAKRGSSPMAKKNSVKNTAQAKKTGIQKATSGQKKGRSRSKSKSKTSKSDSSSTSGTSKSSSDSDSSRGWKNSQKK